MDLCILMFFGIITLAEFKIKSGNNRFIYERKNYV